MSTLADAGTTSPFGPEHDDLRGSIRRFVESDLVPHIDAWERSTFPDEVFTKLAAHGCLGLKYPERVGREGGDHLHEAVLVEELGRCGSGGIGAHIEIATPPVWTFGTDDQQDRYLAPAISGTKIAEYGIERMYRDARLAPIGGGTDEIMREILGRSLVL